MIIFSAEFLLTLLVVVMIPGTGVNYTVSTALLRRQANIAAGFGCTAGIIPHVTASIFGLSAIFHMSVLFFQGVKFAGAAYLLYLAWSMQREKGGLKFNSVDPQKGLGQIVKRGFLINILNPKLSIFFLAILPLFVTLNASSPMFQIVILSIAFVTLTLVIYILYGMLANGVRQYVVNSSWLILWLHRSFAVTFVALGVKLALTEQYTHQSLMACKRNQTKPPSRQKMFFSLNNQNIAKKKPRQNYLEPAAW